MKLPATLALSCALALIFGVGDVSADPKSDRLESIRKEIEAREKKASEYQSEAEGVVGELDEVDRQLAEVRRSVRRLRTKERSADGEDRRARKQVKAAERALSKTRRDLEVRLVALYKFASTGGVASLYTAGDFQSFARSRQNLARILDSDRQLFQRHRARQLELVRTREASRVLLTELKASRKELAVREDRARRKLVERKNLVATLRNRADREKRAAAELRDAAQRLEKALARMPSGSTSSAATGLDKGRLPQPVAGAVRMGFGRQVDTEFGTETLRNGIEFEAPMGAPVHAVASGRVLFAGWFRGYGQMVIVDHGRGDVSVSGYLNELGVEAGADLEQGDQIGTVGDTGSLSGPGLYFEIRHRGKPVDPRVWLGL